MIKQDFRTVLWDITADKMAMLPPEFVIQRVLSYGTIGLILLSIQENGIETVKKVFSQMKPSALSVKKYEYLKKYLLV